jgi:3-deoxy-7-phosphoheptulonate synthase
MVIIMELGASPEEISNVSEHLEQSGFTVHRSRGVNRTILGAIGDKRGFDPKMIESLAGVQKVVPVSEPYKLAGRLFHPEDTVISVGDVRIGSEEVIVMAGPCSVESAAQTDTIAAAVSQAGAKILRGGAFKPRTSPYAFQGLGEEGLRILRDSADRYGLLAVSEVVASADIPLVNDYVDIFQIGARNMQNFDLLRQLGRQRRPVLLKRGASATIKETLLAAEYIMSEGNHEVIICERGIRTFTDYTRNTLDLAAIPVLQKLSHLPVIADPSHGTGRRMKVLPMARAAIAAGADGLIIEVHHDPENALSDGQQSLYPEQFSELMQQSQVIAQVIGRKLEIGKAALV